MSNEEKKLVRDNFAKNIVIVTGVTRSGKSMLAPIVASFKRAELVQINLLMEQFPALNNLGLISDDVATYLLRFATDYMLIGSFLGRDVNFRHGDMSSVWRHPDPERYFKRLTAPEGDIVLDEIAKADPYLIVNIHYGLLHVNIFQKAFPNMKMLHLERHPTDVIHSWYKKGYGKEFALNPRNGMVAIEGKTKPVSYLGVGWEDEYEKLPEMDRIIHTIYRVEKLQKERYNALSEEQKAKIAIIKFEAMVTNPTQFVPDICSFLNMEETVHTPQILVQERCPRTINLEERKNKFTAIKELSSQESFGLLEELIDEYEGAQRTVSVQKG